MTIQSTRREILRGGLAAAGLGVLGIPEWALPALAQGETVVQFTDIPDNVSWDTPPDRRLLDVRTIDGPFTPEGQVRDHPALRSSRRRPGHLQAEDLGPGRSAEGAVARRSEEDGHHGPRRRLRVLGQPRPAPGAVRQRQVDRRAAQDRARFGRRQGLGARVRLLRRRSRRRGNRVAHAEVQARSAVRPQPEPREGDVDRTVPRLGAERRAADQAPGRAAASASCPAGTASPTSSGWRRSTSRKTPTSASTRRAGTARFAAR